MLPSYLVEVKKAKYYYGSLTYEENIDSWIIEGEPCVVEMAKRLFPGSSGRGQGIAKFKNNKRINGDLNWLMQRYPLRIKSKEIWDKSYKETIQYVIKRDEFLSNPKKEVPLNFKGNLMEFQKEGLGFLLNNSRTLLADEMGLGKTIEVLSFIATTNSYPAIIVVPPWLITNWKNEINKFLDLPTPNNKNISFFNDDNKIHVIKGLRPYKLPSASIYIIHYLLLRGWKNVLPEMNFRAVIFDEVQELRNSKSEKYSAASLLAESTTNCIGASGTPIYNHGGEIWNVMNIIDYHCLGDWDGFTREWCTGYGSDIVRKPELLNDYLKREGLMLRRTKKEVLKELPPKRRVVQEIDFDTGKYGELIQGAIDKAKSLDNIKKYFDKGRAVMEIVNEGRKAIGIAKAPYVCAFVKMLLFAYHHSVYDIYKGELKEYNPMFITGLETVKEKASSVDSFMNDNTNLLVISLRAGAGLNLQKATCVVFGELDWSPAVHSQCEDRGHRIGQKDSLLCYYLVAKEGTDEEIQEHLGLKVSQFIGIMGDKAESQEDKNLAQNIIREHMTKIVEKLKILSK